MRSPRRLRLAEQLESRLLMTADTLVGDTVIDDAIDSQSHGAGCACPGCSGCHYVGDGHDHSADQLVYDIDGNAYYIDPLPPEELEAALPADTDGGSSDGGSDPTPMAADEGGDLTVPVYHSNPDSLKKIYLDFDGQLVNQTSWNSSNNNQTIHARAYSADDDIYSFSEEELDRIHQIWERVAEDYSPFNVDVTTEDPGTQFFRNGGQGIRVIVSTNVDDSRLGGTDNEWFGSAGGVGYINSWNWQSDTPVWVFSNLLGNGVKKVSEAAAHEVGHALGLSHDGVAGGTSYFEGHGDWAPIMGNAYHRDVTQWSRGEYDDAQNAENDLAIITSKVPYRFDDHNNNPNEFSSPTPLTVDGTALSASGIIEQGNDVDAFSFSVGPGVGQVDLSFDPFHNGPNLNLKVKLHAANGTVLFESSPENDLSAAIQTTLDPGEYYLAVSGIGEGDPGTDGYSQYASLGQYTISGVIDTNAGDVNNDMVVNASDIDSMRIAILAANSDSIYDLNGDGVVSRLDMDEMIYNVLGTNYGDANLDGVVDATDFGMWSANKFQTGTGWATGDFNGDFTTDASDFNLWSENRFDVALALTGGPAESILPQSSRVPRAALSESTAVVNDGTIDQATESARQVPSTRSVRMDRISRTAFRARDTVASPRSQNSNTQESRVQSDVSLTRHMRRHGMSRRMNSSIARWRAIEPSTIESSSTDESARGESVAASRERILDAIFERFDGLRT